MSQKPAKETSEEKKKPQRKKRSKQTLTQAVTHIRLIEANAGKLSALDQMMSVYVALCQRYVSLFCSQQAAPSSYAPPVLETELSERLHRVAIQQAAGIAKGFRTNRQAASDAYLEDLAEYVQAKANAEASGLAFDPKRTEPVWREWRLPELRVPVMQANANVVVVEKSEDSTFDYWLRISTLDKGNPLRIPSSLPPITKASSQARP